MNLRTLLVLMIAALAGTTFAAPPEAAAPATSDGLVAVKSRNLDEFYVRPNADLSGYRKIIVDPGQAALKKNWLKDMNATRAVQRWLVPEDAQRITDEAASSLGPVVTEVFKTQGYEIVSAPGAGRVAAVRQASPICTSTRRMCPHRGFSGHSSGTAGRRRSTSTCVTPPPERSSRA